VADSTPQQLADLIDAFNKAWIRPELWEQGQYDEASVRLRELWGKERDRWTINLLDLIRTWLLWPEDGPDTDTEHGLPSWTQNVAQFKENMTKAAEIREMEIIQAMDETGGA
jgi:hypothetical protein